MIKNSPQSLPQTSLPPIMQNTSKADGLIRLRESILNRLSGVSHLPVINDQPTDVNKSPPNNLSANLISTVLNLKTSVMDASGANVDYTALKHSPTYADYRQSCLAALRQFEPRHLLTVEASQAFWINLYNALVLDAVIHFGVEESVIEGRLGILAFFRQAAYQVGRQRVSLEDIEHGILRSNRGNPYVPGRLFPATDPRLAWSLPLDPRIHFALNCGGRSCPPIRAYTPENLDQQLDIAARGFVDATVEVHPKGNEIVLSQIFRWFAADFGGHDGIIQFLIDYLPNDKRRQWLLADSNHLRFNYSPYDWRLNVFQSASLT